MSTYVRDGAEIYRRSFATIRAEADLDGLEPVLARTVVRMIHACGMVDLAADVAASPGFGAGRGGALRAGAPILCDTSMVAAGVTRARLPAGNDVVCTLSDPRVAGARGRARHDPHRRRDRAVARPARGLARRRRQRADRALPPARGARGGRRPRPAAVIGVPVGFVGAAESKDALAAHAAGLGAPRRPRPARRQRDRRRRRQRARERGRMTAPAGRLLRRRRRPRRPGAADGQGAARRSRRRTSSPTRTRGTAAASRGGSPRRTCAPGVLEVALTLPRHDRGHRPPRRLRGRARRVLRRGRRAARRAPRRRPRRRRPLRGRPVLLRLLHVPPRAARRALRDRGRPRRDVVQRRGRGRRDAAAKRDDVLTVLPGTLPAGRARGAPARQRRAVVIKLGRTFERRARARPSAPASRGARVYVERASSRRASGVARCATSTGKVPYMSLVLVPTAARRARERATAGARAASRSSASGRPAPQWLTPRRRPSSPTPTTSSATRRTSRACPPRRGQRRHASRQPRRGERARHALELAAAGARVAVVSSGDPGIFAMASAVLRGRSSAERRCRTSTCASCPGCRRCRPRPRASARRSATTSA